MSAKHTPGPWHVMGATGFVYISGGNPQRIIADFSVGRPPGADAEDRTNARLAAASPKLLSRLVRLVAFLEHNPEDETFIAITEDAAAHGISGEEYQRELILEAKRAIAEATHAEI